MPNDAGSNTRPIALVTGGNTGIGFETCKGLLDSGFHLVVCARSQDKAEQAAAALLESGPVGGSAEPLALDLASLASVREAANDFLATERPLSVCVLNAGVMALPWSRTSDGFEQQWQVNVLGHFLFCRMLLPSLEAAEYPTGRVVWVASGAHRLHPEGIDYDVLAREHESPDGYDQWRAYGRSKLANILLSDELSRRLRAGGSRVTSNALHPGNVNTGLWSKAGRDNDTGISPEAGAQTSIFLATSEEVNGQSGGYYFASRPVVTVYDGGMHANADYAAKSAMRSQVSLSAREARTMWAVVSGNVGLREEIQVEPKQAQK